MYRSKVPGFLLAFVVLTSPSATSAWGSIGHRVVGQIADAHLTPAARKAVSGIMNSSSLGSVANWMDEIRKTEEGQRMKPWHFQSVELCKPGPAACPGNNCAGRRIAEAIATLKKHAGQKKKSVQAKAGELTALRVLVHLVGDIHEPLHAAENADAGANFVTLLNRKQCFDAQGELILCNLHSYWDTNLVKAALGTRSEKDFVSALSKKTVDTKGDAESWIKESNAIAKEKVHTYEGFACAPPSPPDPKTGKEKIIPRQVNLGSGYDAAAKPVVEDQLAKGGQRLAAILNDIYK